MLSTIFGCSKYYVDNLSENMKPGNREKIANGWRPNCAPISLRVTAMVTSTIALSSRVSSLPWRCDLDA